MIWYIKDIDWLKLIIEKNYLLKEVMEIKVKVNPIHKKICLCLFVITFLSEYTYSLHAWAKPLKYRPLKGKIIVLDAGHGGKDEGASYRGLVEKNLDLSEARFLKKDLEHLGARVIMTRNSDHFVYLSRRGSLAKKVGATLFISLHTNATLAHKSRGTATYYNNYYFRGRKNPYPDKSKRLALCIQSQLSKLPLPSLGTKRNDFRVLRTNSVPSVLLEVGYLDNQLDRSYLIRTSFQQQAMEKVAEGIVVYYGFKNPIDSLLFLKKPWEE